MIRKCKQMILCLLSCTLILPSLPVYAAEDPQNVPDTSEAYVLTVNSDNGNAAVSGTGVIQTDTDTYSVESGSEVTVSIVSDEGYVISETVLNDEALDSEDGVVIFDMPAEDSVFTVKYAEDQSAADNSGETFAAPDGALAAVSSLAAAPQAKTASTHYLSVSDETMPYGGYGTRKFLIDGKVYGYCIEPGKTHPSSGTYSRIEIFTISESEGWDPLPHEFLRAAMWFSYGAPGFQEWMWPDRWYDGTAMTEERYMILSHLLCSKMFMNSTIAAGEGTSQQFVDYMNAVVSDSGQAYQAVRNRFDEVPSWFDVYFLGTGTDDTQLIVAYTPVVSFKVQKTSLLTDITSNNGNYSLAGAKYGIYSDQACTQLIDEVTTDASGRSETIQYNEGTVYIKETAAPQGYQLDTQVHTVQLSGTGTQTIQMSDQPLYLAARHLVEKVDSETGENVPQGDASLAGAEFTVNYYNGFYDTVPTAEPTRTWVIRTDSDGRLGLADETKVSGDPYFYTASGTPAIPLGTITIQETKAPEGYLLNDEIYVKKIDTDMVGSTGTGTTYQLSTVPEDVIRGDIDIVKYGETNEEMENSSADIKRPLEGVKFHLTSKTTGDTVTITTDEKGYASTRQLGNSEDGNLVYDTYTVTEESPYDEYDEVDPFEVRIDGSQQTFYYILRNDTVDAPIRVQKVDETTGKIIPIADTEFQLLDADKNVITMTVTHYPELLQQDTWKTDSNGTFLLPETLEYGTYYLRELNAPEGYLLGGDLQFVVDEEYQWEDPLVVSYADMPAMGRIELIKKDSETGDLLAGAEFTITAAENIVTPDGTVRAEKGETVDVMVSGEDGAASSKELYLGKYTVTETKQPEGYVLPDLTWDVELLYEDQYTPVVVETLEAENTSTKMKLQKTDASTGDPVADVLFDVWNKETGEKMTVTTDEDGIALIERIVPGVYCVQEIAAPLGYVIDDTVYEFTVTEDGRIDGQEIGAITIENDKTEISETKVINVESGNRQTYAKDVTAVDTVSMVNLQPGTMYTLVGILVDQATGRPLYEGGSGDRLLTVEQTFTATDAAMDVEMTFEFDASAFAGKTIVVFEYLYLDGVEIARHADLNAVSQQLEVMAPELHTTAIDLESGSHEAVPEDDVTIRDKVDYTDIIAGTYTLRGIIMDKSTGKSLIIDGKEITAEKEVTISENSGTLTMDFTFDASELTGKEVVIYEYLYRGDELIASHEDINDEGQTVEFSGVPDTGDRTNVFSYLLGVTGAGIITAMAVIKRRKRY